MKFIKIRIFLLLFCLISMLSKGQDIIIDSLHFHGNTKTKTSFLQRLIKVAEGDVLDSVALMKDMEQLKRMPSVGHAYFQIEFKGKNKANVKYGIQERFTLLPEVNVWSSKGRTWFKTGLHEYNAFGKNIAIGGFYQNNGKHSFGLNFKAPYLFTNKMGLSVNYLNWISDEPLYFGEQTATYEYQNRALDIVGIFEPSFNHKFEIGGSVFNEVYTYLSGGETMDVPRHLDLDKYLSKIYYQFYKIKQHYQYQDGVSNDLNLQAVYSRKDNGFYIVRDDFKFFKRIKRKGNFGARLRFGLGSNSFSPFSPFVIDNHENVRGVGDRINRGTGNLTLNLEYRHTLIDKDWLIIQGVGFTDHSTLRLPGKAFKQLFELNQLYSSVGIGTRFTLKRIYGAVLRIDYGVGIHKKTGNGLVIGLGQYF